MRAIKVMADYQCFSLWETSPGKVGNIDPDSLPISQCLKDRLHAWEHAFDATLSMGYPPDSGFESDEEEVEFKLEGYRLAKQLRDELSSEFTITVHV